MWKWGQQYFEARAKVYVRDGREEAVCKGVGVNGKISSNDGWHGVYEVKVEGGEATGKAPCVEAEVNDEGGEANIKGECVERVIMGSQ